MGCQTDTDKIQIIRAMNILTATQVILIADLHIRNHHTATLMTDVPPMRM